MSVRETGGINLGHLISNRNKAVDLSKKDAMLSWPKLKNIRAMRGF